MNYYECIFIITSKHEIVKHLQNVGAFYYAKKREPIIMDAI